LVTILCKNLAVDVAGSSLLENINIRLESGEKAGLIGVNGAGKTSLLRVILGELPYTGGIVQCSSSIGYLPQITGDVTEQGNVFDSLLSVRDDILEMRKSLRFLEIRMAQEADEKTLEQYSSLTEKYEYSGGYALESKIRRILSGLGLEKEQTTAVDKLSGGQKTRLALGKLLIKEPELLILDEPTNHLDVEALEWLEDYLREYPGAVLTVSHDRYFLDQVVSKMFLVQDKTAKTYTGNYSEFELQRALEEKTLMREAEKMNKKILALEEYVRRHRAGIKAKQARGREIQLRKLTPVAALGKEKSLSIHLQTLQRAGDRVLDIYDMAVSYQNKTVFQNARLELRRGDRIALLGKNGVGKTSLLKAVIGKIPFEGKMKTGANVSIGYYSQEHEDIGLGDKANDIMDEIRYSSKLDDPQIRSVLAKFGFRGDDVFKPVKVLSGGEKSRLALCKLFLTGSNLLLLDEPTNHLDMDTREVLEEALLNFNGTIITVSHDRYFLNRLIDKIALLTPKGIRIIEGDYATYREIMEAESRDNEVLAEEQINSIDTSRGFQEESRNNRRREKKIRQLEEMIENTEKQIKDTEIKLENLAGDYELTLKLHNEYEKLKEEYNNLMQEWLNLSE